MRAEAKVGLFVLAAFAALFALSTRVSVVANFGKEGYRLYAQVPNAKGLEVNSRVSIFGVEAGFLESMKIQQGGVLITLFIYKAFEINDDSTVVISQESLLGGNSINIVFGSSARILKDGESITHVKRHASIDEAVDEIKRFANTLNDTFDSETQADLKSAIKQLKTMGENLSAAGEEFRIAGRTINDRLPQIVAQIDDLTAEFNRTGSDINAKLPEILDKFSHIEDELLGLITENRQPLKETITSVNTFFDKGSETLESLDGMFSKVNQAELQFDLTHGQMINDSFGESSISVAYLPNPTNYYMIGVTSAPMIDRLDADGKARLPKLHDDKASEYFISAQIGKRYDNWLLRAGLIKDTGGAGIDYFSSDDSVKLSLEAYDFNAVNDIRGSQAHLRFTARYLPWKHIALFAGYDNFLNSDADNFFAGAGVHFVDDDLKYLMLSTGTSMVK